MKKIVTEMKKDFGKAQQEYYDKRQQDDTIMGIRMTRIMTGINMADTRDPVRYISRCRI
jgi:hypothetical protein